MCAYTPKFAFSSLLLLAYSKEITTTVNITTTTAATTNKKVNAKSEPGSVIKIVGQDHLIQIGGTRLVYASSGSRLVIKIVGQGRR